MIILLTIKALSHGASTGEPFAIFNFIVFYKAFSNELVDYFCCGNFHIEHGVDFFLFNGSEKPC